MKNGSVSVTSDSAQLTIAPTISSSSISYNPTYKTINNINYVDVVMMIRASTTSGSLSYQWQQSTNGGRAYSNITGGTYDSIAVGNIPKNSYGNYKYRVLVSNSIESTMVY